MSLEHRRPQRVRLEIATWDALHHVARRRGYSVAGLVAEINAQRTSKSLTAAIRNYLVEYYRGILRARRSTPEHIIEQVIVSCVKENTRAEPTTVARQILENLWAAGFDVTVSIPRNQ